MNLLLDTHTYLWQRGDSNKLPPQVISVLGNPENTLFVSVASLWEIQLLVGKGRITLDTSLEVFVEESRRLAEIQVLPIEVSHFARLPTLPFHHRDPFDRLLVAQAQVLGAWLVNKDATLDAYGVKRIWSQGRK